jgi:hypothetical protein
LRIGGYGYEGGIGTTFRASRESHSAAVMSAQAASQ